MIIHQGAENLKIKSPVVTLGAFDGVHTGHKFLLAKLTGRAREAGGESVVITFSPHPRMVLEKEQRKFSFLSTDEEKRKLLAATGIDHLVEIDFNEEFSRIEACDFVRNYIIGRIGAKYLLVGHDHHFGKEGTGDFETLKLCRGIMDFNMERIDPLHADKITVSSTLIRNALLEGRLDDANNLLGYNYFLTGQVIEGRKIGRLIGYPTANLQPDPHKLIPSNGVYAAEVSFGGRHYPGMLSIGTNPTVSAGEGTRSIEVNILNFAGDLYGRELTVIFRQKLRDEIRFDSMEKLAEQMSSDREDTLKIFLKNN